MKRFILLLSAAAFLATSCEFIPNGIKGNGEIVKEEVEVNDFSAVNVSNGFDVYLTKGDQPRVTLEVDENLLPHIKVRVEGKKLIISSRKNIWKSRSLKAHVTYTEIEAISASGGSDIYGRNTIKTDNFSLNMSGGTDADLDIEGKHLKANLSGGSDLELEYVGESFDLSSSGGSDAELTLRKLVDVYVNTSGGSDVSVIGESKHLTVNSSGGSDFNARGFSVAKAKIDASGAADVRIKVTDEISVSANGASSVHFDGGAKIVSQDISKSASFRGE